MSFFLDGLIFIVLLTLFVKAIIRINETLNWFFVLLSISLFSYSISYLSTLINQASFKLQFFIPYTLISEWSSIIGISTLLCSLTILIHESKPPFARFPIILAFLPLLIIASFPWAMNTIVLKNWMTALYQGVALTVTLLLLGNFLRHKKEVVVLFISTFCLLCSYLLFWLPISFGESNPWIWKLILIISGLLMISGLPSFDPTNKLEQS